LAANSYDFAYYCPQTQFAKGPKHLQAKVTGLYVNCELALKKVFFFWRNISMKSAFE
jgi:hypothetical protein